MSLNSVSWHNSDDIEIDNSLNNDNITVQLCGIDSMLSRDDSILQGIEEDSINAQDDFDTIGKLQQMEKTTDKMDTDVNILDKVYVSESSMDHEGSIWHDDTFLNQAFSQIHPEEREEIRHDPFANDIPNLYHEDQLTDISALHSTNSKHNNSDNMILNKIPIHANESNEDSLVDDFLINESLFQNSFVSHKRSRPNIIERINSTVNSVKHGNATTKVYTEGNNLFYGLPGGVKHLIQQIKGIQSLYEWQDECLKLEAIGKRKNLIYALPTSGGKTLVAEILMLRELLCNKKNAIFILPFVAIVQEKVHSLAPFALELGFLVEEYAATKGQYPPKKRRKKNSVYICTIEKALGLVNSLIECKRFEEVGIIVVDELHLLGEHGGRGATLEGLLTKAMCTDAKVHIVGMSATIGNLNEVAQFLNADLYTRNFRPVEIKEYVKCDNEIWLIDTLNDDVLTDMKKLNYRYSAGATKIDPDKIGGLVMDVIPNDSCLIFCATRKNCENVALLLTKVLFGSILEHKKDEKKKLLGVLRTEEGLCPVLSKTIPFGVAYHHSGLTSEERRLLEDAFREGVLCVICCTSTLAAGVNLPARRVILRSPRIGNQFMNLSRYKQMIGRAGRAGMGNVGESILICNRSELSAVKDMLVSKMDDCLSTLHTEKDRGIYNLVLSSLLLSMASTRRDLHSLMDKTLLSIQKERLEANVKHITDSAISNLLKCGVIKVKENKLFNEMKPNISIDISSQNLDETKEHTASRKKRTVTLTAKTELELCNLGRAAMKGPIDLETAYTLYQDLKTAQNHLILLDHLHLLYLVTPYHVASQVEPVGSIYYDVITNLSVTEMETARLLGIDEGAASKLRSGIMPKNIETRVFRRFYVTLMLYELWNHRTVYLIADKYQVNRGIVQNLLMTVSTFASSVVRFCEDLQEFWAFRELLAVFSKKLSYCCPIELEKLMELPSVKIGRARQLYNAGFTSLQSIAKANPEDLYEKIQYLSKKSVGQLIAAANILILEKVEDLRDEAEDVLDGIDAMQLIKFATNFK